MYQETKIAIDEKGNTITVRVEQIGEEHVITIDGVEWVRTGNYVHATVLYNMISDHITEYMHYESK
jgi:hypothetical protein